MELIITQSASVARILATFFNANNRHFDYYSSQTHLVVWIDDCMVDLKPLNFKQDNDSFGAKNFFEYKLKLVKRTNKNIPCVVQSKKVQLINCTYYTTYINNLPVTSYCNNTHTYRINTNKSY